MRAGYLSEIFASFQGEGVFAGRRHVLVRMAGCNLRCTYCDTPGSLERTRSVSVQAAGGRAGRDIPNPIGRDVLDDLVAPFLAGGRGVHAVAITGGEPLLQGEFLAEWLRSADLRIPILLETNGTRPVELERVLPWVSIVSMDLKLPSNSGEPDLFDRHERFLAVAAACDVYVKVPVDDHTAEGELETAARLVSRVRPGTPFFIQPILTADSRSTASVERLERFYDVAAAWLDDVRVLPQAHPFLGIR